MVCAEFLCEVEFFVLDIDRGDEAAGDLGVATRCAGVTPPTLTALYVVTPAQVSGAASNEEIPSGTWTTYFAWATAYSAYAPSIE